MCRSLDDTSWLVSQQYVMICKRQQVSTSDLCQPSTFPKLFAHLTGPSHIQSLGPFVHTYLHKHRKTNNLQSNGL
jgi:hypothetical protein